MDIFLHSIPILFATYLIWKIGDSFDLSASYLTRNLSDGIKGPTINAVASSLPELLIASFFLFFIGDIDGFKSGFATIIGSSIFNIALIPTIAFLVIYFKYGRKQFLTTKEIINQDGLFLILTVVVLMLAIFYGGISITFALCLIFLYSFYIYLVFKARNKVKNNTKEQDDSYEIENKEAGILSNIMNLDIFNIFFKGKKITTLNAIISLFISVVIMAIACYQMVISSERLSEELGVEMFFVTFIITAIASSVPDTILSIKDAEKEKYKDAFSNAYASNIFDICVGIGLPVLIYLLVNGEVKLEIPDNDKFLLLSSSFLLLIFSIIITSIYWWRNLNLSRSIIIIALYLLFLISVYVIVNNKDKFDWITASLI